MRNCFLKVKNLKCVLKKKCQPLVMCWFLNFCIQLEWLENWFAKVLFRFKSDCIVLHLFISFPVAYYQMLTVLFVKQRVISFSFNFFFFQGYLPANVDRRESTLQRKRKEYFAFVEQYYDSRNDESHQDTYRQVEHLLKWLLPTRDLLKNLKRLFLKFAIAFMYLLNLTS